MSPTSFYVPSLTGVSNVPKIEQCPLNEIGNLNGLDLKPALASSVNIIGISTFGLVDLETGVDVAGFGFLVPTSIIQEFLDRKRSAPR